MTTSTTSPDALHALLRDVLPPQGAWSDEDTYVEHGVYAAGDSASSVLLAGFTAEVTGVFDAPLDYWQELIDLFPTDNQHRPSPRLLGAPHRIQGREKDAPLVGHLPGSHHSESAGVNGSMVSFRSARNSGS